MRRVYFISRRALLNLSLLAVVACLVGAMKLLGESAEVAEWVSAGFGAPEMSEAHEQAQLAPLYYGADPAGGAVSLLVQLGAEVDEAALRRFLQTLAANSARASFFVSGRLAEERPELLKNILAGGHELGCCGYDPAVSPAELSAEENREALDRALDLICQACGERPKLYLPPFGVTEDDIRRAAADCGLTFVLGGVDSQDWRPGAAPEDIIAAALGQAQAGSFISLTIGENTLEALDTLLKELTAQGLGLVAAGENLAEQAEGV